jgi:hypothetical protein
MYNKTIQKWADKMNNMKPIGLNIKEIIQKSLDDDTPEKLIDHFIAFESLEISDETLLQLIREQQNYDVICWALLKLKKISDDPDAHLIVDLLNIDDSRIRELASETIFKHVCCFSAKEIDLFNKTIFFDAYVKTVKDINPRVTRNITATFKYFDHKDLLLNKLMNALKTEEGPFVTYWVLDGIVKVVDAIQVQVLLGYSELLVELFNKIAYGDDHLLKEKVASILTYFVKITDVRLNPVLEKTINKIKADDNFYVSQVAQNINY